MSDPSLLGFIGVLALMVAYTLTRHIIRQIRADRRLARELKQQQARHQEELEKIKRRGRWERWNF